MWKVIKELREDTKMILFINACVRKDSRTKRLADHLISELCDSAGNEHTEVKEVSLKDIDFPKTDEAFLQYRDACVAASDFSDPIFDLAKDFALADCIVIAAPFWDLSFPAVLKHYFEQINVTGITFTYSPEGIPQGLCRAKSLYYVTTAGGSIFSEEFGYGYVKALAQGFYGITETRMIKAEGLDIDGADVEEILKKGQRDVSLILKKG